MIVSYHRIDGVFCVPAAGWTVRHVGTRISRRVWTDHDPVSVTTTLHRPSRRI